MEVHCVSHLNEGSVPDLAVQSFDMWGQVHVQQEVILQETSQSLSPVHTLKLIITKYIVHCHVRPS